MTNDKIIPGEFKRLLDLDCIKETDLRKTKDGFHLVYRSVSDILANKGITYVPDREGKKLLCDRFFDDWYLYAVPGKDDYVYSLLKMREQEHDLEEDGPADGDTPGVTISFIGLDMNIIMDCLENPTEEHRAKLNVEVNRVVAYRGQKHHPYLKKYFLDSKATGAYLVASLYTQLIASLGERGYIEAPDHYKEIVEQYRAPKSAEKYARLPRIVESINEASGMLVCDHEKIFFLNKKKLSKWEGRAILATHTGNDSIYSFAAEVEFHAKFLSPAAKIRLPFLRKSLYESAIRADMTIGGNEHEGRAPFYSPDSKIVKRHKKLHKESFNLKGVSTNA